MLIKKVKKAVERFLLFILRRRDPLTGLLDRSALDNLRSKEFEKEEVTLIFIDLDNFKRVNDCLGHQLGDIFLKDFADLLQREVRNRDLAVRWGGDEFVVCLFGANESDGLSFLKRIKMKVKNLDITRREDFLKAKKKIPQEDFCGVDKIKNITERLDISGGVAEVESSVFEAVAIADSNMYKDKEKNINKVKAEKIIPITDEKEKEKLIAILEKEIDRNKAKNIVEKINENGYMLGKKI